MLQAVEKCGFGFKSDSALISLQMEEVAVGPSCFYRLGRQFNEVWVPGTLGESDIGTLWNGLNGNEQVSTTDVVRTKWPVDEVVMLDKILLLSKRINALPKIWRSLSAAFYFLPFTIPSVGRNIWTREPFMRTLLYSAPSSICFQRRISNRERKPKPQLY